MIGQFVSTDDRCYALGYSDATLPTDRRRLVEWGLGRLADEAGWMLSGRPLGRVMPYRRNWFLRLQLTASG